jgi:hypothetical protein
LAEAAVRADADAGAGAASSLLDEVVVAVVARVATEVVEWVRDELRDARNSAGGSWQVNSGLEASKDMANLWCSVD